jgi:alkanesulfonate monooxygenase SsuD/methylene tetrahydromethanopterin reductase-like flavin-dependent oxidoreductase (luciferase family)
VRFGLVQEGEYLPGSGPDQRYHEMIEEVLLAEEVGFHVFGTSEQHFSAPRFSVSAPEVLYAAIAAQTDRIRLRTMCSVMLKWNHPVLVAERLATLDILSRGRAEVATARSNNLYTLDAFGVKASETAEQWDESMEVLVKALTDDILEHDGKLWQIPPRPLVPRCVQKPHPAISVAASSVATHTKAGRLGFGAICFENYFGFDYMQSCIDGYREGLAEGTSLAPVRNESMTQLITTAYCAETREEALRVSAEVALGYFQFIVEVYAPLAQHGTYEYLEQMRHMVSNAGNLDFLLNETPSVLIGTPDDFVTRLRELEERGIDEVIMRIDGIPSADIQSSVELIGREVIPAINGATVVAVDSPA